VVWNSSNPAVATVSSAGLVTAVGPGTATITASSEGRESRASFTVNPPKAAPVAAVALASATVSVDVGATAQLEASLRDDRGQALADRTATWKSSDERIARVDQRGLVTGIAKGTATITASSEGSQPVLGDRQRRSHRERRACRARPRIDGGPGSRWSAMPRMRAGVTSDRAVTWSSSRLRSPP
jgi:uncharacterized protein YjdB